MRTTIASLALLIVFAGLAIAQEPPPPAQAPRMQMEVGPSMEGVIREPDGRVLRVSVGKWWKDSELMQKIGVTDEQVQKIEKIFQGHRLDLIDLRAALEKQEAILEPLVEADQPNEVQVVAQIDKVAQARANLEKSNAQMLLAIRRVLTLDQWKKLRDLPGVDTFHTGPVRRPVTTPLERRYVQEIAPPPAPPPTSP